MGKDFLESMQKKDEDAGVVGDILGQTAQTGKDIVKDLYHGAKDKFSKWKQGIADRGGNRKVTAHLLDLSKVLANSTNKVIPKLDKVMTYLQKDKDIYPAYQNMINAHKKFHELVKKRAESKPEDNEIEIYIDYSDLE